MGYARGSIKGWFTECRWSLVRHCSGLLQYAYAIIVMVGRRLMGFNEWRWVERIERGGVTML